MSSSSHCFDRQQQSGHLHTCNSISTFRKDTNCLRWSGRAPRQCWRLKLQTEAKAQRAVVLLPGLGNSSNDYKAVGEALESRGLHVQVACRLACQKCAVGSCAFHEPICIWLSSAQVQCQASCALPSL